MVQAYAVARPSVRFTFKVLKAKNDGSNWMYAPGKQGTLMEAALKIAGADVASNCAVEHWPRAPSNDGESLLECESDYRLAVLLPKLGSGMWPFQDVEAKLIW